MKLLPPRIASGDESLSSWSCRPGPHFCSVFCTKPNITSISVNGLNFFSSEGLFLWGCGNSSWSCKDLSLIRQNKQFSKTLSFFQVAAHHRASFS